MFWFLFLVLPKICRTQLSDSNLETFISYVHLEIEQQRILTTCGGVYIHPVWVLTAAHCLIYNHEGPPQLGYHGRIRAIMGTINPNILETGQRIKSQKLIVHHEYLDNYEEGKNYTDTEQIHYDVGVLLLRKSFSMNRFVGVSPIDRIIPKRIDFLVATGFAYDPLTLTDCTTKVFGWAIACKNQSEIQMIDGAPVFEEENYHIVGVISKDQLSYNITNLITRRNWVQQAVSVPLPDPDEFFSGRLMRRSAINAKNLRSGKRIMKAALLWIVAYFFFGQYELKADSSQATLAEFPSFAHLDIEVYGMYTYCAGSYIDNYWVATAAHCLDLNKMGPTKLGEHDRVMVIMGITKYYEGNPGRQWRKSVRLVVHPDYYTEKREDKNLKETDRKHYDIGLVKLNRVFEITEAVAVGLIPPFIPENTHFSMLNYLFEEIELTDCEVGLTLIVCKYDDFEKIDGAPIYLSESKQIAGIVGGNKPGEYNVNMINYRDWIENITTRKLPIYKPKLGESLVRRFAETSANKCSLILNSVNVIFYGFFSILYNILRFH